MKSYLGFLRTTWSNYENAITEPSIDGLIQISNFFGIRLDELILSDLSANNEQLRKGGGAKKTAKIQPYIASEEFPFTVNEAGLFHIIKEVNKLKEEIDILKGSQKKGAKE